MYTLGNLEKELAKARDKLREVDDSIHKNEGNVLPRFVKQEPRFDRPWVGGRDEDTTKRRRQFVEDQSNAGKKRSFAQEEDGDTSPLRKKAVSSVVGEVKLDDLTRRVRNDVERSTLTKVDNRPRSVFARLSAPTKQDALEAEGEDDDEDAILKRQPTISSRVFPISHPAPSREQALAAQKKDEAEKRRGKRMFSVLVGALKQFRQEETQEKELKAKRQEIERKLEEDALREKERMKQEKRALISERLRRESDIKRIEWSLNRVKEFEAWETSVKPLHNFIQTKATPQIFYMPKILTTDTTDLLNKSQTLVKEMIDHRRESLNTEIETSEKKAKRAAGEIEEDVSNEVNKENLFEDNQELNDFKLENQNDATLDEEDEQVTWEEAVPINDELINNDVKEDTATSERNIEIPEVVEGPMLPSKDDSSTGETATDNAKEESVTANPVGCENIPQNESNKDTSPSTRTIPDFEISQEAIQSNAEEVLKSKDSVELEPSNGLTEVPKVDVKIEEKKSSKSSRRPSLSRSRSRSRSKSSRRSKLSSSKRSGKSTSETYSSMSVIRRDRRSSAGRSRRSPKPNSNRRGSSRNRRRTRSRSPRRSPRRRSPKRSTRRSSPERSRKRSPSSSSSSSSSSSGSSD